MAQIYVRVETAVNQTQLALAGVTTGKRLFHSPVASAVIT